MGEIVNLRRARKARERAEREIAAAENRAKSGMAKPLRELKKTRSEKEKRDLEGKRLDQPEENEP